MELNSLLQKLVEGDGSDLYLSTGAPPSAKFQGELVQLSDKPFGRGEIRDIANSILNQEQQAEFESQLEMNLAIAPENIGRFRINMFIQRNEVSIVARNIQTDIPKIADLGLPEILKEVITAKNGLVLFVGGTGSGKSTSLAALIDHRNEARGGHIITIEDPVEYVHQHKKCIVNQREVGVDTLSYHDALKNTLRQAPDVILIGEIRDRETMEHALAFAETGHLAISTLHANNANQALDRIINFFPEERRTQLLQDMGNNLRAFISQRLVPTVDGKRCAAIEIMLGSHTIKKMIQSGDFSEIKEVMLKSENHGMKTFDSALFDLVVAGRITQEEALKNADSANNLRLKLKFSGIDMDEEDDDPTQLLMRGEAPAKAANDDASVQSANDENSDEADSGNSKVSAVEAESSSDSPAAEDSKSDLPDDLGAMLAAAANPDAAPSTEEESTDAAAPVTSEPPPAPAAAMELSLEEEPEEDFEEPLPDEEGFEAPKFGMGRIG
ncbi:MAG: PilT/PilU family type 4a pilus ATPase [Gammaproteobacteria bacterium]|nr:PilT/PilU family type 4a pilus ATPase [Gammaproteobacteria bacterium]